MKNIKYVVLIFLFLLILFQFNTYTVNEGVRLAEQYLKKIPVTEVDLNMTLEQAIKVQEEFVTKISEEFGNIIGYKAGLTSASAQEKFGVSHPLRGTLLEKMLLKSGSEVPANLGGRSMSEGDLIVRVGSDSINQAETIEEALECIDAVIPFIELPDLVYDKSVPLSGPILHAINVGARFGIIGDPILIKDTSGWIERLANFRLQVYNEKEEMLAEGKGSDILGHPMNVVLWIRDSLKTEGKTLKKGDLLSLGTITPLLPAKPNTTACHKPPAEAP